MTRRPGAEEVSEGSLELRGCYYGIEESGSIVTRGNTFKLLHRDRDVWGYFGKGGATLAGASGGGGSVNFNFGGDGVPVVSVRREGSQSCEVDWRGLRGQSLAVIRAEALSRY